MGSRQRRKQNTKQNKQRQRSRLAPLIVNCGKHNPKEYKRIDNGTNRGSIYGIETKKKTKHTHTKTKNDDVHDSYFMSSGNDRKNR
jgi:hypothetical protein